MVRNLDRWKARLARIPQTARKAAEDSLRKEADGLAEAIRRYVPLEEGTLRDSVRVENGAHELSVRVVAGGATTTKTIRDTNVTFDYARAVEFGYRSEGGKHVMARPFFFPTYRARRKAMLRRVKAAARKALKAEIGS